MKDRSLKQLMIAASSVLLLASCAGKPQEVKIYPIQDNVQPRGMARSLFTASDELVASLGLEEGELPLGLFLLFQPLIKAR